MTMLDVLEQLCELAASFYERRLAFGSTGNISVRVEDEIRITPTGASLRKLAPEQIARVDLNGKSLDDNKPSKETPFHLAIYRQRPEARAVVHLHSTYSVMLSCLETLDEDEPIPPLTPYYFMRVAPLGVVPYFRPGSPALFAAVEQAALRHHCLLLRNHGAICCGASLSEAADRAEELEETAKLFFLLRGEKLRYLAREDVEELR